RWHACPVERSGTWGVPEGDTIFQTAAALRPLLVGREVLAAQARTPGPAIERVVGSHVTSVEPFGKHMVIRFDNGLALHTHLRMAGVGNVFKSDILFVEGVNPWTHVSALGDDVLRRLVATAHRLLLMNVAAGVGPHRVTTTGDPSARGSLWVYGRSGRACTRCRTPIRSRRQGALNRPTYWCPNCQPA